MLDLPVVIVTGGAQGIGLGITQEMLAQGWAVAVLDRDYEALQAVDEQYAAQDQPLLTYRCDVADERSVKNSLEEVIQRFGRVDGLVNNAGIADPVSGPVQELALARWQQWIDVDLTGPFLLAKHAVPHLQQTRGAIVNISSTRALQSEPNCEAYAAAKGGLITLTHALAVSLAGQVRVNAISPGWIAVDDFAKPSQREQPDLTPEDHAQHPAGRVGRPADIASLCRFLLSEEAGFITGESIVADGGMTRKMIYE